jgi:hypothetical protein
MSLSMVIKTEADVCKQYGTVFRQRNPLLRGFLLFQLFQSVVQLSKLILDLLYSRVCFYRGWVVFIVDFS